MTAALKYNLSEHDFTPPTKVPYFISQEILRAVQSLKFGSVEIVVRENKVIQIERKEKQRLSLGYER